jgi:predicted ATPase with chaperone activity
LRQALKVARTIADLAEAESLTTAHVAETLQLRRSLSEARS